MESPKGDSQQWPAPLEWGVCDNITEARTSLNDPFCFLSSIAAKIGMGKSDTVARNQPLAIAHLG